MLSLEKLRKIDPELANLSDEELTAFRADLYETTQLAFDAWWAERGSKNPIGSSPAQQELGTL